ncbi:MAG: hypothetical protein KC777_22325 [Cyanobacteria bacterium HKST-UBA02]|nr:hypothetical protein [Cyanobacteria bacterium HKST-UBA02]
MLAVFNDFRDEQPRRRILFGSEEMTAGAKWEHCPDCLAPIGTFHHPGCDIEQCPCCNKQAISCNCVVQFPLEWWFFAEEREVSQEILRVAPIDKIVENDPGLARMLKLPEGKKAFREEDSDDWEIRDID